MRPSIGGCGRAGAAMLVGALLGIGGCSRSTPVPRKQVLARLPARYGEMSLMASTDLRHTAFQEKLDHGRRMVHDGKPGPVYDFLISRSFAPETNRVFYWAQQTAADGREETFLVADGTPYAIGLSRHEYLTFTADGSRWAVVATAPKTADGPPPEERRVQVLVDGVEQGRWMDASVPAFSDDGAHVAWLVVDPAPEGETRRRLLVDGAERATFSGGPGRCISPIETAYEGARIPHHERVAWLSDGRPVALVRDGAGWLLRRGDEALARYPVNVGVSTGEAVMEVVDEACRQQPAIASGSLAVAAKAPAAFWWERSGERWRVVRDGVPVDDQTCERAWDAQPPVVSDDGTRWAYPCVAAVPVTGQEVYVTTSHGRFGPYREVWTLALSDDGARVAYGASPEGGVNAVWHMYVDGVAYRPGYYAVWRPRFDPGGRHVAWEGIPKPGGRPVLAVDGRDLTTVDALLNGPFFLDPGWASWGVRQGRRLARVNLPLDARFALR